MSRFTELAWHGLCVYGGVEILFICVLILEEIVEFLIQQKNGFLLKILISKEKIGFYLILLISKKKDIGIK